jgi:hypothetical protein
MKSKNICNLNWDSKYDLKFIFFAFILIFYNIRFLLQKRISRNLIKGKKPFVTSLKQI